MTTVTTSVAIPRLSGCHIQFLDIDMSHRFEIADVKEDSGSKAVVDKIWSQTLQGLDVAVEVQVIRGRHLMTYIRGGARNRKLDRHGDQVVSSEWKRTTQIEALWPRLC